jgi:hypothetical protein
VEVGDVVVLVEDVQGVPAGKEGKVMGVREDLVMVGCRIRERLEVVLVRPWEVLPEAKYQRFLKRRWPTQ